MLHRTAQQSRAHSASSCVAGLGSPIVSPLLSAGQICAAHARAASSTELNGPTTQRTTTQHTPQMVSIHKLGIYKLACCLGLSTLRCAA